MELEVSRHRDNMDWSSDAVDPLEFPIPAIMKSQTRKIMARDHRTGEQHVVKALLRQETHANNDHGSAYLLKRVVSKSEGCREKMWAAIVLQPASKEASSSTESPKSPFDVHWETTTQIVTIRVCSWVDLPRLDRQRLVHVSQIRLGGVHWGAGIVFLAGWRLYCGLQLQQHGF